MAGLTVARGQQQDARSLLDEALLIASEGWPQVLRDGYRDWLTTPSETLRMLLDQAGEDVERWHHHRAPALLAQWRRGPGLR